MKLYAVSPINWSYNDEFYSEEGLNKPVMAFRKKENAEAKAKELNEAQIKRNGASRYSMETEDGPITNYYTVSEVEAPDVDVGEPSPTNESAYDRAIRMKNEARKAAREAAQSAFKEGAKALFDKHPLLTSFTFRAYTPYFCDGETCTYGVYADEPDLNGESWEDNPLCASGEDYKCVDGKYTRIKTGEPGALYQAWSEDIPRFVHGFDNEDIMSMFGDHVEVTVSYDRATGVVSTLTDEYSHD